MARKAQAHVFGGLYFVCAAAEYATPVFVDDSDRLALNALVAGVIARCGAKVHAFCWSDTRLLLLLQVYDVSVSNVMRRIASPHARRVNKRSGYKGCLFRHPHRSALLDDAVSVMEAVRTIHSSAAALGVGETAESSRWNSYRAYLGLEEIPWLTTGIVLDLLSATTDSGSGVYTALLRRPTTSSKKDLRDAVPAHKPEEEIFFAWLKRRFAERAKPASLDQLIQATGRWLGVSPASIESKAISPLLSLARALIAWSAMQNGIASLSELSRRFDRSRSTLYENREVYRLRLPELFSISLTEILQGPSVAPSDVLRLTRLPPEDPPARKE